MKIGVRAHDIGGVLPAEALAQTAAAHGFDSVQLTLDDALEGFVYEPGCLQKPLAERVSKAFAGAGVEIAVFSCYINPVHPDLIVRRAQIDKFREFVRNAAAFGARIVATETGSRNPDGSFTSWNHSEEAFSCFLESLREMVAEAERFGVTVCIEGVERFVIHDPQSLRQMLNSVSSPNLQILFDPVNLLSIENYTRREEIIAESLALFGDRIVVFHAKDFVVENGTFRRVPIGEGCMDFRPVLQYIWEHAPQSNVIVEEYWPEGAVQSAAWLREQYKLL